jgi:hypothetical protein
MQAEQAVKDAVQKAVDEIGAAYVRVVDQPCQRVQVIYDELTGHGTKALDEQTAIQQAIQQDQKQVNEGR